MRWSASAAVVVISLCVIPTCLASGLRASITRIVSSRADLRRTCKFAGDLSACTAFEARRLDAVCAASGAQWKLVATASMQPVMYLWDTRSIAHENLHIADMGAALAAYLERLGLHRYDTEGDCSRAADADMAGFARQVDLFATASNELRHYKYAARNAKK